MIQIESLSKYYHQLCAVDEISFDVRKGEILGLLGPNGAGKTTTLRMLTCFLKPTSGNIRVKDYAIDKDALEIKRIMGYLPESAPLYHDMLVYDYLTYVAAVRGVPKPDTLARLKELSEICGLNSVMHQPISELSKGYKQRVGLAHAMMNDPQVLVLDEPTSGLDPNQIVEIRDIIKQIGRQKTVILSTHILSEAEATCDRIVIINRGKIVADGSTENLKKATGREKVVNLILAEASFDDVRPAVDAIAGVNRVENIQSTENELHVKLYCDAATDPRPEIYAKIKTTDWILLEFNLETQTLEDIFRNLTQEN